MPTRRRIYRDGRVARQAERTVKRWTTPPKWRLGRDPGEEKETLLLDWESRASTSRCRTRKRSSPAWNSLTARRSMRARSPSPTSTPTTSSGPALAEAPGLPGLYIVVELKGWSVARIGEHPRYIHDIQNTLAAAGFRLPFGWVTFPIYGASGGPTSRICFPVLDRVGSTRGSKTRRSLDTTPPRPRRPDVPHRP